MHQTLSTPGIHSLQGFLSPQQQLDLVDELRAIPFGTAKPNARQLVTQLGEPDDQPQSCLVNVYQGTAQSLGLHQDKSEQRSDRRTISLSLGARDFFLLGGRQKTDPKTQLLLQSGDVLILAGENRLGWHSFQGVMPPAPPGLIKAPWTRINLTIRQVY